MIIETYVIFKKKKIYKIMQKQKRKNDFQFKLEVKFIINNVAQIATSKLQETEKSN